MLHFSWLRQNEVGKLFQTSATLVGILFLFSACATPQPWKSNRRGLFARWDSKGQVKKPHKRHQSTSQVQGDVRVEGWVWPLDSLQVTSAFGSRDGGEHEGVDLRAKKGAPIYAVNSGKVLYSGSQIAGYGKMVVIKHESGHTTVYAHASRLLVRARTRVQRGQKIAEVGATGRATGPHLHFEVRQGSQPVEPMQVLAQAIPRTRVRTLAQNRAPAARTSKKEEVKIR